MKLGELRQAVLMYPPDMDDCQVIILDGNFATAKELAFTAHSNLTDTMTCFFLGTKDAAKFIAEKGNGRFRNGETLSDDDFKRLTGEQ